MQYDQLLTPEEVQRQLHISAATLRNWVYSGKIESIQLPSKTRRSHRRFRQSEVTRLLNIS
jgi:excisionase family DNA binding protein